MYIVDGLIQRINTAILTLKGESFAFMNSSAQKLLGWDIQELNKNFAKLASLSPLLASFSKLVHEILKGNFDDELSQSNKFKRFEINIEGQYYNLYLSKLAESEYLLELSPIVYQDMKQTTHELKRPIQNIKTLTEVLIMGAKNDPLKCDEYLAKLNTEADRLGTLVNDMLSLSHIVNGVIELHLHEIQIKPAIDKIFESLQTKAVDKKIDLVNQVPDYVYIHADKKLLEHLLSNLIDNAIKYNRDNGKVIVKAEEGSLVIQDTGLGMSEEDTHKIFEQFYRIKDRTHIQGNGLGLNIVKGIIELHGWQIEVSSKLGEGSEFVIRLT